jgi:hypothetical protein
LRSRLANFSIIDDDLPVIDAQLLVIAPIRDDNPYGTNSLGVESNRVRRELVVTQSIALVEMTCRRAP